MASEIRLEVAVPCPLRNLFSYKASADLGVEPGCWVEVPFGRRRVTGLVLAQVDPAGDTNPAFELKEIFAKAEQLRPLDTATLELIQWSIRYYHVAPWDIVSNMVPLSLLQRQPGGEKFWVASTGFSPDLLSRARRRRELLLWMQAREAVSDSQISAAGFSPTLRRELVKQGLVSEATAAPGFAPQKQLPSTHLPQLTREQHEAVDAVALGREQVYLLQGPTGSGKTEVYMAVAKAAIAAGRQVLLLVPEIGLTPQMEKRIRQSLPARIATYHSEASDADRRDIWQAFGDGNIDLVIGTRSAIFLPAPRLGLIVLDEEQDVSYKQQEGWRYHARHIAALRARQCQAPLVLGSATPSLESLFHLERGRYIPLQLTQRHGQGAMPIWQIEPLSPQSKSLLSQASLEAIEMALQGGNQVMVFINRRGFAPAYECQACRWVANCPNCSCRLTAHLQHHQLLCHQCQFARPIPNRCDQCHSQRLQMLGAGTERLENFLQQRFAAWPALRVDRDSTRQRGKRQQLMEQAAQGQAGILVGTQMLAKGHHFPGVTLVVVLGIDQGLLSADPWAMEQTAQLCIQVAGRAGRGKLAGRAILETGLPEHPVLLQLTSAGYQATARELLRQRRTGHLPPFSYWALLRVEHQDFRTCEQVLQQVVDALQASRSPEVSLLGPMPCLLERRGDRYRYQLLIQSSLRSRLHEVTDKALQLLEQFGAKRRLRWSVDVDPLGMD